MPAAMEHPLTEEDMYGEGLLRRALGLMTEIYGEVAPVLPEGAEPEPLPNHYGLSSTHPLAQSH